MKANDGTTTKYRPSKKWYVPIEIIGGVMLLSLVYSILKYPSMNSSPIAILLDICLALALSFYTLFPAFGMFVTFSGKRLCRIDYFILKKSLSVDDIVDIQYLPTFITGRTNRTLTITADRDDEIKQIMMSYPTFTERTLASVVNGLRKVNPSIQLDEEARALADSLP
jgi:hypothetical protein